MTQPAEGLAHRPTRKGIPTMRKTKNTTANATKNGFALAAPQGVAVPPLVGPLILHTLKQAASQ